MTAPGAWTLGFAPVLYLALRGGGYDPIVRGELGIAVWWGILIGALTGLLPLVSVSRAGWACVALLAAFTAWTGLAVAWSLSAELTVAELGRNATYLGFLVLGLTLVRADGVRSMLNGVGTAFGLVAVLAVLSQLYPSVFSVDSTRGFHLSSPRW